MYYPRQIPQLLNETFKKSIIYKEYHLKELQDYIMCVWHMKSIEKINNPILNTVLPDGCIDLIIDLNMKIIIFTGFSRNTEIVTLEGHVNIIGVRLKPGAFHSLFHINTDKIMDHTLLFNDIDCQSDLNIIFETVNISNQLNILTDYLSSKISEAKSYNYIQLVDSIYTFPTNQYVKDLEKELGYESRQLQRLFLKHYGVTPKVLLNILRLHKCLTLLFDENLNLHDIALDCGFYDQAHFIKEIKRYTGILPTSLLEEYKQ